MSLRPTPSSIPPMPMRPVWVIAALAGLVWAALFLWPRYGRWLGIADYGTPFLDSYAVLAALDAMRAGVDPHGPNALDPLMRGHVYSDWWLGLRWLGLTRADNWWVGLGWAAAFGVVAGLTTRPRGWAEAWWFFALLISPPFLLALSRGNNDLVIFVILAGVGLVAGARHGWQRWAAMGCLGMATGLKYFTAPAALALLWYRPVRAMPAALLAALVVTGAALVAVWDQIERARFVVGSGIYTFGAPLLGRELGGTDVAVAFPTVVILGVGALLLTAGGMTRGLARSGNPAERCRAAVGALVLLTCFVSGMNYSYRWIFVVWPAVWLWRRAVDPAADLRTRGAAKLMCLLIAFALWSDGLLCLSVNLAALDFTPAELFNLERTWRLWTQPFVWLAMIGLAGYLLEGGVDSVRSWWATRHDA